MLMLAGFLVGRLSPSGFFLVSVLGTSVGLGGFAYLCVAIRCPNCDAKWIWLMASRRRDDPLHWGFGNDRCPVCGHAG